MYPGYQGKSLLINARAEGILERRTFRDDILVRRCVIPAKGFYEWSPSKEKYWFEDGSPILFLAGCFNAQTCLRMGYVMSGWKRMGKSCI
ncbi:MAG: SOS response-associated peptidase [Clostridiales bacterium]|nr:SOS response-associated peptidase [Clostridiales bacterium]